MALPTPASVLILESGGQEDVSVGRMAVVLVGGVHPEVARTLVASASETLIREEQN